MTAAHIFVYVIPVSEEQRTIHGKPVPDEQTLTALRERAEREGLANESEAIRAAVRAWAHVA
ncbi:ribbon-helix-helix protein, CopG family [Cellulosimicrobium aquatile]|nr:ribbon-helix-helix protein, CopG family [Cellulosimicrobium aquatile]